MGVGPPGGLGKERKSPDCILLRTTGGRVHSHGRVRSDVGSSLFTYGVRMSYAVDAFGSIARR